MRVGDQVAYVNSRGGAVAARVQALVGSGPSGFKTLDLEVDGVLCEAVPHENDRRQHAGYWTLAKPKPAPAPPRRRVVSRRQDETGD